MLSVERSVNFEALCFCSSIFVHTCHLLILKYLNKLRSNVSALN